MSEIAMLRQLRASSRIPSFRRRRIPSCIPSIWTRTSRRSICSDCGEKSLTVWGFIRKKDNAHAV